MRHAATSRVTVRTSHDRTNTQPDSTSEWRAAVGTNGYTLNYVVVIFDQSWQLSEEILRCRIDIAQYNTLRSNVVIVGLASVRVTD